VNRPGPAVRRVATWHFDALPDCLGGHILQGGTEGEGHNTNEPLGLLLLVQQTSCACTESLPREGHVQETLLAQSQRIRGSGVAATRHWVCNVSFSRWTMMRGTTMASRRLLGQLLVAGRVDRQGDGATDALHVGIERRRRVAGARRRDVV